MFNCLNTSTYVHENVIYTTYLALSWLSLFIITKQLHIFLYRLPRRTLKIVHCVLNALANSYLKIICLIVQKNWMIGSLQKNGKLYRMGISYSIQLNCLKTISQLFPHCRHMVQKTCIWITTKSLQLPLEPFKTGQS